jgi:hypothetical protein
VVFDDAGNADLGKLLASIPATEFDQSEIRRVLESSPVPEDWRVGEAIAEAYLVNHRVCNFPWPDGRDERRSGSSLPGADLLGFQQNIGTDRFAFGEVKTSGEDKYPPANMYGRTGLKMQLEDLRDNVSVRDDLVKYLGHRALNATWKNRFIQAWKRYVNNNTDVQIFGLLIRDVPPHKNDLETRVTKLTQNCPSAMAIELMAIYLPGGTIATLSEKVVKSKYEGGA